VVPPSTYQAAVGCARRPELAPSRALDGEHRPPVQVLLMIEKSNIEMMIDTTILMVVLATSAVRRFP
jgi:hypothetical protein